MKRILIIDDKSAVRQFFEEELQDRGFQVRGTGVDGRIHEIVEEFPPDLVLLDLYSRGSQRWDHLVALKERNPSLAILIVTAFNNYAGDPRLLLAEGVVIKNHDLQELLNRIHSLLFKPGSAASRPRKQTCRVAPGEGLGRRSA